MSKLEEYGFDVEKEMKHLENIVELVDSLTVSSRFIKYLIQQAKRVEELEEDNHRYKQALETIAVDVKHIAEFWYIDKKALEETE